MSQTIDDWELSAFIDGDLPPRRLAEIESGLERLPEARQTLLDMIADHWALGALGQAELEAVTDVPPYLAALAADLTAKLEARSACRSDRQRRFQAQAWPEVAGLAAGTAVGAAIGWTIVSLAAAPRVDALAEFVGDAAEVHRANDVAPAFFREPSQSALDNVDTLFARRLFPPDLTGAGFTLAGIDVAGTDTGVAPVFVYTDRETRRLSLVLSMDTPILAAMSDGAAPRVTTQDGLAVSYGQENGLAYAVIGAVPESRVRKIGGRVAEALRQ